jgi:hypothetical protein
VDSTVIQAARKAQVLLAIISNKVVSDAVKVNKVKIKGNGTAKTTKEELGMDTRELPTVCCGLDDEVERNIDRLLRADDILIRTAAAALDYSFVR